MSAPVTRGRCPGCQNVLRIPPEWALQTFRCKRCGATLQGFPKAMPATAANGIGAAAPTPDSFATITPPSGPTGGNDLAFDLLTANPASALARHRANPAPRRSRWIPAALVAGLIALAGVGGF